MKKKQRARRKPAWYRTLRESGLVSGLGVLVIAAATWITYQFVEPAPPRSLRIATGSIDGAYRAFGQQLKEHLAKDGVALDVIETRGSLDNLQRLSTGKVDVAFMQSGLVSRSNAYPTLQSLGTLYHEPAWIFTRQGDDVNRLNELTGRRIAIGGVGSGSRKVAVELFRMNSLGMNDAEFSNESGMAAVSALEAGEIDAVITVASVSAPMVKALLQSTQTQLMSLSRAPAYARREPWLTHLTLPEGVVDLTANIPSVTIDLLAVNATLVTTEELHPALRDLILQAADEVFSGTSLLSASDEFPKALGSEFALAPAAARFYEYGPPFLQRYLPFWIANLVDRLKLLALPLIALVIPITRLLPPAYRWSVRKKIFRWYEQVQDLDQSSNDDYEVANLARCKDELLRIENEVRDVEVPLSYASELYVLRQHIELLLQQIDSRLKPKG